MAAGLPADIFWDQTSRTYEAILRGAVQARISAAWWSESMARQQKLKPLGHYVKATMPVRQQTPAEMLAALRSIARGKSISIRKVDRDAR